MNRNIFKKGILERIRESSYVKKCTNKSVTYTYEFKKMALEQYNQGVSSREIWRRAGFDINIWRQDYPRECLKRWRKIVKSNGLQGLAEPRWVGRPKSKGVTDRDIIKRLNLQIKYLKAENVFLVKLRAKRAESNSGQKKSIKSSDN